MKNHTVVTNGVELNYLDEGSGRPLVFVHGAVTTSKLFKNAIKYFSHSYRVLAVDLRGYGRSEKPGWGYQINQFADDLAAFFENLELESAVLVGVSMGGFVVQQFALDHQSRLRGLVLASTSDGDLGPALREPEPFEDIRLNGWEEFSRNAIISAFPHGTELAVMEELLNEIPTWNEQVIRDVFASIIDFSTRQRLAEIRVPTLILVGTEDRQLPLEMSQKLERAIPESALEVFDGSGHFIMIDQPAAFCQRLEAFVEAVDSGVT